MSISLCMIVKNEETYLGRAIESAKNIMGISDIVVVDTGSEDKTKEIALAAGAAVYDFEWCDDFAAARNFAADKANNDWILRLDADEEITEADMREVSKLLKDESARGVAAMAELSDDSRHETDLIYNRKTHSYHGSIHEHLKPRSGIMTKRVQIPVLVNHSGYTLEMQQERGKFERNISMLERELKKDPDNTYYLYHMGKSYFNFNRDLNKACEYFEKVLSLSDNVGLGYIYTTVECYGYALINTEKYREALNLLEVYYPHYKGNPQFRFLAAHIYQNNGLFAEAVECYESCIGADIIDTKGITSYLSYYNIGVILECLDMTRDAVAVYKCCGDYEPALARIRELEK